MANMLEKAFKSVITAIAFCYFHFRENHPSVKNHHHHHHPHNNVKVMQRKGRPLALQTIDLKVRMCCVGCERLVKRTIYKLKGINNVEVDLKMQKVTVVGYVDRHKVLKRVRRAGKRAEFWPYPDIPLFFTTESDYFKDTLNEFKESYNYYKHGYNLAHLHGTLHMARRGDDRVSNMFNDDNVNGCFIM